MSNQNHAETLQTLDNMFFGAGQLMNTGQKVISAVNEGINNYQSRRNSAFPPQQSIMANQQPQYYGGGNIPPQPQMQSPQLMMQYAQPQELPYGYGAEPSYQGGYSQYQSLNTGMNPYDIGMYPYPQPQQNPNVPQGYSGFANANYGMSGYNNNNNGYGGIG